LSREGSDPLVTIRFRRLDGRAVAECQGTNQVLEDAMLHGGTFQVTCQLTQGGSRGFTIEPPAPE
jgi:hypothetical protein